MTYLTWLLKAAIFFTLFAFALNNQQVVGVHFFFGTQWQAPLVLVVLVAFASGLALGVIAMIPRWWRKRRLQSTPALTPQTANGTPPSQAAADTAAMPPHGV